MLAGRRSYADLFLKLSSDSTVQKAVAYFYDFNAKASMRLGSTGTLVAGGYLGRDNFGDGDQLASAWGNRSASLRWNQIVNGRLFSKVTTAWSDYDYLLKFDLGTQETVEWVAGIRSLGVKVDEVFNLTDKNAIEFGIEAEGQKFRPGKISSEGSSAFPERDLDNRHTTTLSAYLGQDVEIGSRLAVRYGLRFSAFRRTGPGTLYSYANNAPVAFNSELGRYEPGELIDSTEAVSGQSLASYHGFEPRVSARFTVSPYASLKASYSRTRQYIQLASRTNAPTPLDVWEPSGTYIKPQVADQVAIGFSAAKGG